MDRAALEDLFSPVIRIAVRRMFGGHGLYTDGMMFGLEASGTVFLRVDAETEAAFRDVGSQPFSYQNGARRVVLPYWQLPDDAFEDPDVLRRWVALGRAAAVRHAAAKAARPVPRRGRGRTAQATSE